MIDLMTEANFGDVFVGVETTEASSLRQRPVNTIIK